MNTKADIDNLSEEQLKAVAMHMAPRSDGWDAGQAQDWDGVRAALAEALEDGYQIEDFLG